MKKIFAVTLALLLLCGCSKTYDDVSSTYVYKEVIPTSTVTENSTETPTFSSTITVPKEAYLYKNAIVHKLTDPAQIIQIAKTIEGWYMSPNTYDTYKTDVNENYITTLKTTSTVVELVFDNEILFGGQSVVGSNIRRILVPITGEHNNKLFKAGSDGVYQSGPITAKGGELESLLPSLKSEVYYVSKATAPNEAYLYKDGVKYTLTDSAQTLQIAKTIESWTGGHLLSASASLAVTPDTINDIKKSETAIEFIYYAKDDKPKHYKLMPITGDHNDLIFGGDSNGIYHSGPSIGKGYEFESLLPKLKTKEYIEPEYTSTVATPKEIYLYDHGAKRRLTDPSQIEQISKEVESWYANLEELPITGIADDDDVKRTKKNEISIELVYDDVILWNGKTVVADNMRCLFIPITGFYSGYVYYGISDGIYRDSMLVGQNYKLEPIIEDLKFETVKP